MKRFIFHVPSQRITVCAITAPDEADAWKQIADGECEQLYTKPGTTASGKVELVAVTDIKESDNEQT